MNNFRYCIQIYSRSSFVTKRVEVCIAIFFIFMFFGFSLSLGADTDEDNSSDSMFLYVDELLEYALADENGRPAERYDTSGNGKIDYIFIQDLKGKKLYEIMDYSRNGAMDDFCIYKDGIMLRREIDSNGDGMFDVWVFLQDGRAIRELRQDTNFDGTADKIIRYSED
jgi:hypothetical protein